MKAVKTLLSLLLAAVLLAAVPTVYAVESDYTAVEPIRFNNPDFIRGMDVSSVISLEQSGVKYYDENGAEKDLFRILSENGVNYIRVRVWNRPYDAEGKGFGGGNSDVEKAAEIGRRAARYGMKLLVDFHYSDFWADPGKQKAPAEWSGLSVAQKAQKVYDFTLGALTAIKNAGADIGMVQVGNETTNGVCGVYDWADRAQIFNAGASAVRAFDKDVLVAIHFTDPQKTDAIKWLTDQLDVYKVDYDVLATSYYPYWHGSLSNLTAVLDYAAEKYGKLGMVAETSYANTLTDTDSHPNTVAVGANDQGADLLWDFSVQGQADEVRGVMNAVNNVSGGKGLGVFYWEGAWITVGDTTGLQGDVLTEQIEKNKTLWEENGSGWAASYSAAYDPDDAGKWYGGSAVDNQAFFDSKGRALPSLRVFRDVLPAIWGDVDGDRTVDVSDAAIIQRCEVGIPTAVGEAQIACGDVNADGEVDVLDATWIQRYDADLPAPERIGTEIM